MRLTKVTLTGADESFAQLGQRCRHLVEWGILRSRSQQGNAPRFPAAWWVQKTLEEAHSRSMLAGHLCGEWARDAISGPFLWAIEHNDEWRRFDRIQLNVTMQPSSLDRIRMIARKTAKTFIVQVPTVKYAVEYLGASHMDELERSRIHFLVDASGGTGKPLTEAQFVAPPAGLHVGYAGGIGPHNVREVLEKLTALPGDQEFWIDLESGLRSTVDGRDVFDLAKCEAVLAVASGFLSEKP